MFIVLLFLNCKLKSIKYLIITLSFVNRPDLCQFFVFSLFAPLLTKNFLFFTLSLLNNALKIRKTKYKANQEMQLAPMVPAQVQQEKKDNDDENNSA